MAQTTRFSVEARLDMLEEGQRRMEDRISKVEEVLGLDKIYVSEAVNRWATTEARMEKVEEYAAVVKGKGKATRVAERQAISKKALYPSERVAAARASKGPEPKEARREVGKSAAERVPKSFEELCKCKEEGSVIGFGSSMARGVGNHLHADNRMFGKLDFGGARIEDIKEKVGLVGDKPDSHMVFMVGTNNLEKDHAETIVRKYGELIGEIKKRKYKNVSMVGILARADKGRDQDWKEYIECKRFSVNLELEDLCKENNIEYIDAEIDTRCMLDWKGLHL